MTVLPLGPFSEALQAVFDSCDQATVACSGGVDSMTLAFAAHRVMGAQVTIGHAISPAVPVAGTERVKHYARIEGWNLRILDAGEFADERYMKNPANRCFFCKSNLYGTLTKVFHGLQLFSGTNTDDLGDWRPGLKAAENNSVRHPFVEAGMAKSDVRALAASFGLAELADLPSSPCLSSRIETGIRINVEALKSIDRIEVSLREQLAAQTIRCRVRKEGVVIELDDVTLDSLSQADQARLVAQVQKEFSHIPQTQAFFTSYSSGSAFLKETLV